jgi:hypothetical protein
MGGGMDARGQLQVTMLESFPTSDQVWRVVFHNENSFAIDVDGYVTCSAEASVAASSRR